tara:strand:+ start:442 stop:1422 length:981 start_codon:yes stop_codon:yes gene_type:complete
MNILYGIQGTGNGHLSRADFIYKLLLKRGYNVDVLISGNNYSLQPSMAVKYRNKGLTFVINNGKIDYLKTLSNLDLFTSYVEQKNIPFKEYDFIITDFEPVTAWASLRFKIPSLHISHQASFLDKNVPRPEYKNILGEYIMKYYCPTNDYIGLHYKSYGPSISEPIISNDIISLPIVDGNHVTVYLPWFDDSYLISLFSKIKTVKFCIFSKSTDTFYSHENIEFHPINKINFLNNIANSYGVISNAGFQTSSEVMYLGKRLMVVPVEGQYEQLCNVAALREIGVKSLNKFDNNIKEIIIQWLDSEPVKIKFKNNLEKLLLEKIGKL